MYWATNSFLIRHILRMKLKSDNKLEIEMLNEVYGAINRFSVEKPVFPSKSHSLIGPPSYKQNIPKVLMKTRRK